MNVLWFWMRNASSKLIAVKESQARIDDLVPRMRALELDNKRLRLQVSLREEAALKSIALANNAMKNVEVLTAIAKAAEVYCDGGAPSRELSLAVRKWRAIKMGSN